MQPLLFGGFDSESIRDKNKPLYFIILYILYYTLYFIQD